MSELTGEPGSESTLRMASRRGVRRWTVPGSSWRLDSGSQSQAEMAFRVHRAAATKPGPAWPKYVAASEPSRGPIMTPALVEAVIQPRALARSSGITASET